MLPTTSDTFKPMLSVCTQTSAEHDGLGEIHRCGGKPDANCISYSRLIKQRLRRRRKSVHKHTIDSTHPADSRLRQNGVCFLYQIRPDLIDTHRRVEPFDENKSIMRKLNPNRNHTLHIYVQFINSLSVKYSVQDYIQ